MRLTSEKTCADDTTILTIAALTTIDVSIRHHKFRPLIVGIVRVGNPRRRREPCQCDAADSQNQNRSPRRHSLAILHYFLDEGVSSSFSDTLLNAVSNEHSYESLWSFVKERNEATTSMSQLTIESPLRNELPVYPSLPFSIKVCESLSKVSTVFNDMALAGELSMQMIDILANLSTLARGDGSASPVNSPPGSPGGRDLLNTIADLRCLSVMATTSIEHQLCFGIIGCCFALHFGDGKIGQEFDESLRDLEDTLVGNGRPRPQEERALKSHRECMIWVSIAAAGALEMSDFMSAMSMVLDQTLERYPDETGEWETLEKILKKYLWNDLLGRHWKRCWRRAMHRRSKAR